MERCCRHVVNATRRQRTSYRLNRQGNQEGTLLTQHRQVNSAFRDPTRCQAAHSNRRAAIQRAVDRRPCTGREGRGRCADIVGESNNAATARRAKDVKPTTRSHRTAFEAISSRLHQLVAWFLCVNFYMII